MKKIVLNMLNYLQKKSYFFRKLKVKILDIYMAAKYRKLKSETPTEEKVVMFESFLGKMYACSPKAIYNYMLQDERFSDYKFVWAFRKWKLKKLKEESPELTDPRTILVRYKSDSYYKYLAASKYWVTNWRLPNHISKKKDQILIETWHGTPLKKIGLDSTIEGNPQASQRRSHKLYLHDSKMYDYLVSPSAFCTKVFATAFGLDQLNKKNILIETGYPRNDYLLNYTKDDADAIKEELNIPKDKKVILYAPTWRDNQHTLGVGNTLDVEQHFFKFLDELSEDYVVIMRLHYIVANKVDLSAYAGKVFDYSKLDDVNKLYVISDILITDYSSVFFDYANLNRPILFYMYDLEEYQTQIREFYIDLTELPGPIVKTQEELLDAVYRIEDVREEYQESYKTFCDTYNYLDDGNAAQRVVDICFQR
ncbi:MAG: CDP-glycerol glycerophosphotransferase family protein [Ruminococcus sp.]